MPRKYMLHTIFSSSLSCFSKHVACSRFVAGRFQVCSGYVPGMSSVCSSYVLAMKAVEAIKAMKAVNAMKAICSGYALGMPSVTRYVVAMSHLCSMSGYI